MKRLVLQSCLAFTLTAMPTFLLTRTKDAEGFAARRQSARWCQGIMDRADPDLQGAGIGFAGSRGGVLNVSGGIYWRQTFMTCPILSDSWLEHGAVTRLNIHGIDADSGANGLVGAQICVDHWTWNGITGSAETCSPLRFSGPSPSSSAASATFIGAYQIEFTAAANTLAEWQTFWGDFPYVTVVIPGRGATTNANAGYSNVLGFYFEKTP